MRQCQPCTACCDGWVQMNIRGAEVYPGCACPHSTVQGCDDYANRPVEPCHHFNCAWILPNSPLPEWFKPSTAKVIVLLIDILPTAKAGGFLLRDGNALPRECFVLH